MKLMLFDITVVLILFATVVAVIWSIRIILANTPKATMKRCYETLKSGRHEKTYCGWCHLLECPYSKECKGESGDYVLE
jgi:hypothetical protein